MRSFLLSCLPFFFIGAVPRLKPPIPLIIIHVAPAPSHMLASSPPRPRPCVSALVAGQSRIKSGERLPVLLLSPRPLPAPFTSRHRTPTAARAARTSCICLPSPCLLLALPLAIP